MKIRHFLLKLFRFQSITQRIPTWVLDIVVKDGTISKSYNLLDLPLWFVISADGAQQPFSTSQTTASASPSWDFPRRLILQLQDISSAYLYFTLCTYGGGGTGVQAIARSRIGLKHLPIGSPKQFTFPLMHARNSTSEVMQLRVIATLSELPTNFEPQSETLILPQSGPSSRDSMFSSGFNSRDFEQNF